MYKISKYTVALLVFSILGSSLILLSGNQAFGITLPVGKIPFHLAIDQNLHKVYVANNIGNTVSVIDGLPGSATRNTVIANITVGSGPVQVDVNSITHLVYVANFGSNTVSVINGTTNSLIYTIPVGNGPVGVAINPIKNILYAGNFNSGTISVINATTNSVMSTTSIAIGLSRVAVDTELNKIYAVNFNSNKLYIINGSTNDVITATTIGMAAGNLAIDQNNHRVFTADFGSNTVSVVSGTTNAVIATIPVASGPTGIAVDTAYHRAYIGDRIANVVSIISDDPGSVHDNKVIGVTSVIGPGAIAIDQTTHIIYVANRNFNTVTILNMSTINPPTADAGPNQVVTAGTLVSLNGSKSTDPNGQNLSFNWHQIKGPSIILSNNGATIPTFIAPNVNSSKLLTFQLIVNDSVFSSSQSDVNVVVNPLNTFSVPLNQVNGGTGGALSGGVNVGRILNNLFISLVYITNQTLVPTGNLIQTIIPLGIDADNISFNVTESSQVPKNITPPPINTALYFTINSSGADFSNPANFAKNLLPLTQFTVPRNLNSAQHFSDSCPVIPFDFFNEGTGQWNQFGDPLVRNANMIYVANLGASTLSVINGSTNSVDAINLASPLAGVTYDHDTNRIYVSNANSSTVSVIDGSSYSVIYTIPVGVSPTEETIDPSMHHVYVVNKGSNTVSVIDTTTNSVTATIPVIGSPLALAVDSSMKKIYVGNYFNNTISVINATTNLPLTTIPSDTPIGLVVDPNTHKVYVSEEFGGAVSVINGTTNSVITKIPVGVNPYGIDIDPNTSRAYVANVASGTVSVIDTSIDAQIAVIPVGNGPISLKVNANDGRIFVANSIDNTISVIDGLKGSPTEDTVLSIIPAGNSPFRLFLNTNMPNPVRDPSTDIRNNTGITQCAYIAQHPHLSKFAVGGIVVPALAVIGVHGGDSSGSPAIVSSFAMLGPQTNGGLGGTIAIDPNNPRTTTIHVGDDEKMELGLKSDRGANNIEHVALYMNLYGDSRQIDDSDTYVIYEKYAPLQIVDPHGYFSKVTITTSEDDADPTLLHLSFEVTFAKEMKKSDIFVRSWTINRNMMDTRFANIIQVVNPISDSMINDKDVGNNVEKSDKNKLLIANLAGDKNSELITSLKKWAGYSSQSISDSEFLKTLNVNGTHIPSWFMKTTQWVVNGDTSQQEFVSAINYMYENHVIK